MKETELSWRMAAVAGLLTWLVVGLPIITTNLDALFTGKLFFWLLAYLAFGCLFLLDSQGILKQLKKSSKLTLLFCLTSLATLMMLLVPSYQLLAILFIITAVEAAHNLDFNQGLAWVIGQSLIILLAFSIGGDSSLYFSFILAFAYFGFQIFALLSSYATLNENKAKLELAQVNAELRATQALVTESSRMTERLRISRDLHDLIGHHLTALSLNLEVANHLTEGKAKESVEQARSIAKLLLSDVRDVVNTLRDDETIDLNAALSSLVEGIPKPKIHMSAPDNLRVEDPNRAQVLVRCIQEVITNSIKHAQAENLYISLERHENGIHISTKDDGQGSKTLKEGNGLTGMKERLEQVGGKLSINSVQGQGFHLDAFVPV